MRRVLTSAVLLLGIALAAAAAADGATKELRVFRLRFRSLSEAAALVEPLLSGDGSIVLQPSLNTLTVTDHPDVVKQVGNVLAGWDVPPASYQVGIRLILASSAAPTPGTAAAPVAGLSESILKLFHFTSFTEVDSLHITATDGNVVEAMAGGRYYIRFTLVAMPRDPDRVQLSRLQVARELPAGPSGVVVRRTLLQSTVSLRVGQTSVVGAARSEEAAKALLLIFSAQREGHR